MKRPIALAALLLICLRGLTQDGTKNYIPPSPTASGLGQFVDVSVGEYSGVQQVSVPLYELQSGGLKLPIALSYFAGGIKVKDEGSWVGTNWALMAGGVITRVKRDKDDLSNNGFFKLNTFQRSLCTDAYDKEPDIFYFSFNGKGGKFYIDYNASAPGYTIRTLTKTNVKIEPLLATNEWKVTIPDGTVYLFEKKETSDETITNTDNSTSNEVFTSSWYVTKATSIYGDQITFEYNNTSQKIYTKYERFASTTLTGVNPNYAYLPSCQGYQQFMSSLGVGLTYVSSSQVYVDEIILNRINFKDGFILFNTTTRDDLNVQTGLGHKLSSIQIYGTQDLITSFHFSYDYYSSGSAKPDKIRKRLRLLSIQESNAGVVKGTYTFAYGGDYLDDKDLQLSTNLGYSGHSITASLKKITFPTSGYSEFEYEGNDVLDIDGTAAYLGVRIKKIKQNDGLSSDINVKKFVYEGGKLLGRYMTSLVVPYQHLATFSNCPVGSGSSVMVSFNWYTSHHVDMTVLGESSGRQGIGYDKVTVLNGENGEFGKTEYLFENSFPTGLPSYPGLVRFFMPINISALNGKTKQISTFKNNGSGYTLLEKKVFVNVSTDSYNMTPAKRKVSSSCFSYDLVVNQWIKTTQETVTRYDQDGLNPTTEVTNFYYDNPTHCMVTRIVRQNSRGENITDVMKYVGDESTISGLTSPELSAITDLKNKYRWATLLEKEKFTQGTTLLQRERVTYKDWGNGVVEPEKMQTQNGTGAFYVKTLITRYDLTSGNALEVTNEDGLKHVYLWGYNNRYPVADVTGSDYNTVSAFVNPVVLTNSIGQFTEQQIRTELHKIRTGLAGTNALVNTYTYRPLFGMASVTDPSNRSQHFQYDGFGRLVMIRDQDDNIVKKICYNYAGQTENCNLYLNDPQTGVAQKNDCTTPETVGSMVTYNVAAGKYQSAISVLDANNMAIADVTSNGPAYANANGTCIPSVKVSNSSTMPYTVTFTNTVTSVVTSYSIYPNYNNFLAGGIAAGTYNISVTPQYSGGSPVQITLNGSIMQTGFTFSLSNYVIPGPAGPITVAVAYPGSGPCSYSMSSGYNLITSSISNSGSTAGGYIVFVATSTTITAGNTYTIATINGSCKPSGTRTFNISSIGRTWTVTVYTSGQMTVQTAPGSAPVSPGTTISFSSFSYAL
jgi:YD repeat-containing protein